jgi:hypothetical protein
MRSVQINGHLVVRLRVRMAKATTSESSCRSTAAPGPNLKAAAALAKAERTLADFVAAMSVEFIVHEVLLLAGQGELVTW